MKNEKFFNAWNDFYKSKFDELCNLLEQGNAVHIYIDCIGHTRNNLVQEDYKTNLIKKYGDKLEIELQEGVCSYSYSYRLI